MIQLSVEQVGNISRLERNDVINSVINALNSKGDFVIKERDTLESRLIETLEYTKKINIKHSGMLRSFLFLEACQPGFSSLPVIRKVLEESSDSEQCYRDIINIAVNLLSREC